MTLKNNLVLSCTIFFLFILIGIVGVSASRIDIIKQGDYQINYLYGHYNNDSFNYQLYNYSNPNFGSFDNESWQGGLDINQNYNRVVSYLCWRYKQDFTIELGYADPMYNNQTLKDWCYAVGDYNIRVGQNKSTGIYLGLPTGFMLFDMALAYNYSKPFDNRLFKALYTQENPFVNNKYVSTRDNYRTWMSFNTSTQYASFTPVIMDSYSASSCFWAKPNIEDQSGEILGGTSSTVAYIEFGTNTIPFGETNTNGNYFTWTQTGIDYGWHFWCVVFNNNVASTFRDGIFDSNSTITNNLTISNIGRRSSQGYLNGSLDEIRIWNISLSNQNIYDLYNYGKVENKSIFNNGLIRYWSFEENNGTAIIDNSIYKDNATYYNNPQFKYSGNLTLIRNIDCNINNITKYLISANVTLPNVLIQNITSIGNITFNINGNAYTITNSTWSSDNSLKNITIEIDKNWLNCGINTIQITQEFNDNLTTNYYLLSSSIYNGYSNRTDMPDNSEIFFNINLFMNRTKEWEDSIKQSADYKVSELWGGNTATDTIRLLWKNANWGAYDIASLGLMYQIFGNESYLNFTQNASIRAEYLYHDGLFGERNSIIFATPISPTIKEAGFDSNYFHIAMRGFTEAYLLTGNEDLKGIINKSFDFISKASIRGDYYYPVGSVSRNPALIKSYGTIPNNYEFMVLNSSMNSFIDTLLNYSLNEFSVNNSEQNFRNDGGFYIRAYENYREASKSNDYDIDTSNRYMTFWNMTDEGGNDRQSFGTVKTKNYIATIGLRGSTPSGGVITTLQRFSDNKILISGNGSNYNGGLGNLYRSKSGWGILSNGWDTQTSIEIVNETYPFKVIIRGSLRVSNTSSSGGFNTTYTFYDDYIIVSQDSQASDKYMQITPLNYESIGSGIINGLYEPGNNFDGLTVIPLDFNLNYEDSTESSAWGTVDKLTSDVGKGFNYIIGIEENSPIWFSSSSSTSKHIASNLSNSVNVTVVLNVKDCDSLSSINYRSDTGLYNINFTSSTWFHQGSTFTCNNNIVTLDNIPIEPATNSNIFTLAYNQEALGACDASLNAFLSYVAFIGLIGAICFLGIGISYLTGIIDKSQLKDFSLIGVVTTLIMVGLLIIIGIFIISSLCGVF